MGAEALLLLRIPAHRSGDQYEAEKGQEAQDRHENLHAPVGFNGAAARTSGLFQTGQQIGEWAEFLALLHDPRRFPRGVGIGALGIGVDRKA